MMNSLKVAIVAGSKSDADYVKLAEEELASQAVSYETFYLSAHRQPDEVAEFSRNAASSGFSVIIAMAGYAAALPGVVAAYTTLPVIGVPLDTSPLGGWDALLSIVQMPKGVPVATMSVGRAGARNAACFCKRIMGICERG
ncbi:5-(carboxyamino)imidazole ribonucleotide mutase [candidate division WOR-3 bacterium]|uniref:N5-carboxyaminoimidazole ribonucleotide mutase n=1 Tax=candidate division WOR-3 bacterium TaxID=2052148 RepID=A0A9D5QDH1_UNCW3|nr:5-(carboxyamino)imidazole ribonucleotide mutase [candidate division WOR-3 bacterium]MBD3365097.1 5-(carboxyamino)imidazole ribonucleotide mutase [candidate division WOR-3 bacterium]